MKYAIVVEKGETSYGAYVPAVSLRRIRATKC